MTERYRNELNEIDKWLKCADADLKNAFMASKMRHIAKEDKGLILFHLQQANEKIFKKTMKLSILFLLIMFEFAPTSKTKYEDEYRFLTAAFETKEEQMKFDGKNAHHPQLWGADISNKIIAMMSYGHFYELLMDVLRELPTWMQNEIDKECDLKIKEKLIERKRNVMPQIEVIEKQMPKILAYYQKQKPIEVPILPKDDLKRINNGITAYDELTSAVKNAYFNPILMVFSHYLPQKIKEKIAEQNSFIIVAEFPRIFLALIGSTCMNDILGPFESSGRYPEGSKIVPEVFQYIPGLIKRTEECYRESSRGLQAMKPLMDNLLSSFNNNNKWG
jgi:hypothetical protein